MRTKTKLSILAVSIIVLTVACYVYVNGLAPVFVLYPPSIIVGVMLGAITKFAV